MIHVCKNPEMGEGFHFLAHGLYVNDKVGNLKSNLNVI